MSVSRLPPRDDRDDRDEHLKRVLIDVLEQNAPTNLVDRLEKLADRWEAILKRLDN